MKHTRIFLLLGCLLAFASCNVNSSYSATNVYDILTVKDKTLVNDFGYSFNVTGNESSLKDWQVEGRRYFVLFDILNSNNDINIKGLETITIQNATPYSEEEELPGDPVNIEFARTTYSYIDLQLTFYHAKKSDFQPEIQFRNDGTKFYIALDANGENPVNMGSDDLETVSRLFSIPITQEQAEKVYDITLTANVLTQDSDGKMSIVSVTKGIN